MRQRVPIRAPLVALCVLASAASALAGQPRATKSWIYIDPACVSRVLVESERWQVPVDYCLDAAEADAGTSLSVWLGGPWIDCPDGKYTKKRFHVSYPGSWQKAAVRPGQGRHVFTFTVPPAQPRNGMLILCYFQDAAGKRFPWDVRRSGPWFHRRGGHFELVSDKPGNLFLYAEPVRLAARLRNVAPPGQKKTLAYKVFDATRAMVAQGAVDFTAERNGQDVPIELSLTRRGTFLLEATVPGWETRTATFARIPDVQAVTKGAPTRFGLTNAVGPDAPERLAERCRIAQRLGLTFCRQFVSWSELEPWPGVYRLEAYDEPLAVARRHGIHTWMCIVGPPAWALPGSGAAGSYRAFACDWEAWRDFVKTATTHYKGRLFGWEWLNEIVPGGSKNPVDDYLTFCRIGTETARAIDPAMKTLLAGGLWPRSFRTACLAAGVGKHVDVLPVHYSNGDGVREAHEDLDAAGCTAEVWDDESGRGISTWGAPPLDDLAQTLQSNWVLTQWPDELVAGCQRIIYFGGTGSAAGNWTYLFDDHTPRPLAATLAVFVAKLHDAKPLGVFALGSGGLFHLFERGGRPVLVASSYEAAETIKLPVGTAKLTISDHQGNETTVPASDGVAALGLAPLRVFVEGGDLDVLKAQVVPTILAHRAGMKRSRLGDRPRLAMLAGRSAPIFIRIRNPYDRPLKGTLGADLPKGWTPQPRVPFAIAPGQSTILSFPVAVPKAAEAKDHPLEMTFQFEWAKLPTVARGFVLSVVDPAMLGNLFPNGDLETAAAAGTGPHGWRINGSTVRWAPADGPGLGRRALKFQNTGDKWGSCGRTIDLRGGLTYLYTAWVRNHDMHAGSNIYQHFADGKMKPLYDVQVFTCGNETPHWQVFTARYKAPPGLVRAGFVPVVKGTGYALYDNLRVSVYEGTDFAAEAHRAMKPPKIDGRLDDWSPRCPIPLIGPNQLSARTTPYAWAPENLSGVAWLAWDDANLYIAIDVHDDIHAAPATGEAAAQGDGLLLALHPMNRTPGTAAKAFACIVSSASPGGGSGRHTLFRPAKWAGGLRTGQLARDSSAYDLAVAPSKGRCTYELRLPFSQLGGVAPGVGVKIGLSLQLNDNDGRGLAAHMNWGGGLAPEWRPDGFGVLTLVE